MKKIFITGFLCLISCFKIYVPDEAKALVSEPILKSIQRQNTTIFSSKEKTQDIKKTNTSSTEIVKSKKKDIKVHRPEVIERTAEVSWDSVMHIIKLSESLQLDAYVCPAGYWTVGYGHLITSRDEYLMNGIVEAQADSLLRVDLEYCEEFVHKHLKLEGNQLKAISLFCFAFGSAKLYRSTLFKKIKAREPIDDEIMKWCKLNGKKSQRLLQARQLELNLYNS